MKNCQCLSQSEELSFPENKLYLFYIFQYPSDLLSEKSVKGTISNKYINNNKRTILSIRIYEGFEMLTPCSG